MRVRLLGLIFSSIVVAGVAHAQLSPTMSPAPTVAPPPGECRSPGQRCYMNGRPGLCNGNLQCDPLLAEIKTSKKKNKFSSLNTTAIEKGNQAADSESADKSAK